MALALRNLIHRARWSNHNSEPPGLSRRFGGAASPTVDLPSEPPGLSRRYGGAQTRSVLQAVNRFLFLEGVKRKRTSHLFAPSRLPSTRLLSFHSFHPSFPSPGPLPGQTIFHNAINDSKRTGVGFPSLHKGTEYRKDVTRLPD
jgi:hypothetical protein